MVFPLKFDGSGDGNDGSGEALWRCGVFGFLLCLSSSPNFSGNVLVIRDRIVEKSCMHSTKNQICLRSLGSLFKAVGLLL